MSAHPLSIRCRGVLHASREAPQADMLPLANVCMLLLPFLLLGTSPGVLRVFNIATSAMAPAPNQARLQVSNHGLSLAMGSAVLASGVHPAEGQAFPPEVAEALRQLIQRQPDTDIVVQPDSSATYADVVGALDTLHALPDLDFDVDKNARGRHITLAPMVTP